MSILYIYDADVRPLVSITNLSTDKLYMSMSNKIF